MVYTDREVHVQLVNRTRHAVLNLSIYRARPVVRRKVLSADGSYGDITGAVGLPRRLNVAFETHPWQANALRRRCWR